eukprot:3939647-Rhodomonas_salina.1
MAETKFQRSRLWLGSKVGRGVVGRWGTQRLGKRQRRRDEMGVVDIMESWSPGGMGSAPTHALLHWLLSDCRFPKGPQSEQQLGSRFFVHLMQGQLSEHFSFNRRHRSHAFATCSTKVYRSLLITLQQTILEKYVGEPE